MPTTLTAETAVCPVCAVALQLERPGTPPHWGNWRCPKCGKHRGWVGTPPSEYPDYVMPFGRNKGLTLSTIASRKSGVDYLRWCAENLKDGRVREVIATYLTQLASV